MANGSVTRRGDSWRARYWHPETGKQHQRTFERQVDAQRFLRQQLEALDSGRWVDARAGRVTFEAFYGQWSQRQVWTDGTHKAMSLCGPLDDVLRCGAAQHQTEPRRGVGEVHDGWERGAVPAVGAGHHQDAFRQGPPVFRAAVRDKLIAVDPTEGVRLPRQRKREASMSTRHATGEGGAGRGR